MRVAFDLRPLQTVSGKRGVGTYIRHLARALRASRGEGDTLVGIVAAALPQPEAGADLADRLVAVGGPRRGRVVVDALFLPPLLRREAADVYHTPFYAPPARRPRGVAIVQTVHDLTALRFPGAFTARQRLAFRAAFRRAARADRVIAVSEATRSDLERLARVPRERIEVIAPGIAPVFHVAATALPARPDERPFLLHVGGYDPIKNLGAALRALAALRGEGFPHRLLVAGEPGPHAARFHREAAALGLADAVVATGFVPDEALADLYRGADLVLYPSLHEGFGLPPLEAMACGTPVVAARAGALPEVGGGACLYADPDDAGAFADAASAILGDDSLARRLSEEGRARAALFTWEESARRTLEVYREAAGG